MSTRSKPLDKSGSKKRARSKWRLDFGSHALDKYWALTLEARDFHNLMDNLIKAYFMTEWEAKVYIDEESSDMAGRLHIGESGSIGGNAKPTLHKFVLYVKNLKSISDLHAFFFKVSNWQVIYDKFPQFEQHEIIRFLNFLHAINDPNINTNLFFDKLVDSFRYTHLKNPYHASTREAGSNS